MASSSQGLHEEGLSAAVVNAHRALVSIQEELEAVDWYNQRAETTEDAALAEVLRHNRDEEKEHAAMTLEWLRRQDPVLDGHLRTYLFTGESIVAEEHEAEHGAGGAAGFGSLGIGGLRGEELL
jgi:uncharacterized protein